MDGTEEKDPFAQAAGNLFDYRDTKLPVLFNGKNEVRRLIFGYCVFFPDCKKPPSLSKHRKGSVEYDPDLIVDYIDFQGKSFHRIIKDITHFWKNHESYQRKKPSGISGKELFKIKNFIRRDIVFELPWTDILKRNDTQFKRYTDEAQEQLLTMLEDNDHMGALVKGGPGTGKTWLALEQAKKKDLKGDKVLFLCFNKNLALFLRQQIKLLEANNVFVIHKDEFYNKMLSEHFSFKLDDVIQECRDSDDEEIITDSVIWNEEIPLKVYSLFKDYHFQKFDYIIMDEAQDYFNEYHIDALGCFLNGNFETGNFLICMDDENQDIYLDKDDEFENFFRSIYPNYVVKLKHNCRNPQKLSDTAHYITGLSKQDCYFKEEVANSEIKYYPESEDLKKQILSFIEKKRLDGISPGMITALCYDVKKIDEIIQIQPELFCKIDEKSLFRTDKVMVSTAHSFKGLENQFILFIAPERYVKTDLRQKKIIYNAFTRAKHQFIYFVNKENETIISGEFASNVIR
ncbi:MAG: DUF2075 domain-containing protein [Bacteroidales bacterium]|nr:DUF2075 domain-containing protein [Bacteroidales bacterium]